MLSDNKLALEISCSEENIRIAHFSSANWRETHMSAPISDCFVAPHWFMILYPLLIQTPMK